MVAKGDPWYPESLLDVNHVAEIKSWGFNTIRLGVMWTGAEPTKGTYNETYLGILNQILDNLEAYGIAALIDVHQDVLSSYFCLYDGAPTWAVDLSNSSTHPFPWPLSSEEGACDRPWFENYFAEATGAAFQDLYDNTNGMRDHFANFWKHLAQTFKDKHILGYELINEPWAGNIYTDPSLLLPGAAGAKNLQSFYDIIVEAIREVDTEHIIFYEPVTWGMIFNGTLSGSGFSHVPGGDTFVNKSVFSFHYYCWWYGNGKEYNNITCDHAFGPHVFDQAIRDATQLGGAMMLTEWGQGCDPASGLVEECHAIMDLADSRLMSWQNWFFFPDVFTWSVPPENIPVFSRTYATSVAGKPSLMHYDVNSAKFQLCYTPDATIDEPTEIYFNATSMRMELIYKLPELLLMP